MSWETCFEISIDLFAEPTIQLPDSRVRSYYSPSDYSKCTCEEVVQRQSQFTKWSEKYTVRILCLNSSSLGQALQLMRQDPVGHSGVLDHAAQLSLLFDLKELCECDRRQREYQPKFSLAENEWGLLDRDLTNDGNGGTFRCSGLAPVSMSLNQVLRPTPTVLMLAQTQSARMLRQRIEKEIKQIVECPLKSEQHNDQSGYVYIMLRESVPDYVKIGFSRKDTAIRNDNLKNCFQDIRVAVRTSEVAHAHRVEKLVHAELMYYRRAQDCGTCGKQHSEWFEVDIRIAKAVMLRWSQWLATEPYERIGGQLKPGSRGMLCETNTDTIVTAVQRQIELFLTPRLPGPGYDAAAEMSELSRREKVRNVRLTTEEQEISGWYNPPKKATAKRKRK